MHTEVLRAIPNLARRFSLINLWPIAQRRFAAYSTPAAAHACDLLNCIGKQSASSSPVLYFAEQCHSAARITDVCYGNVQGAVVNVSSVAAIMPINSPTMTSYAVAKAAQDTLTKNLAFEFATKGVRINSVLPGESVPCQNCCVSMQPRAAKACAESASEAAMLV